MRLELYNALGQPVRTLVDQFQAAGAYQVPWDARDGQGAAVATGVYVSGFTIRAGCRRDGCSSSSSSERRSGSNESNKRGHFSRA